MDFFNYPTEVDAIMQGAELRTAHGEVCKIVPGARAKGLSKVEFSLVVAKHWYEGLGRPIEALLGYGESAWASEVRPYYKIYPSITPALLKIPLEIDSQSFEMPLPTLAIRFPKSGIREMPGIQSFLALDCQKFPLLLPEPYRGIVQIKGSEASSRMFFISVVDGTFMTDAAKFRLPKYMTLECQKGRSIEESLLNKRTDKNATGWLEPQVVDGILRLLVSISLMATDPMIIRPEVLDRDQRKFELALEKQDQEIIDRLVKKAKQRGVVGWSIGEHYEICPHYRRPHPALVWTQKGRIVPKIIFRAGSIVHRKRTTDVPTGYTDETGRDIEG